MCPRNLQGRVRANGRWFHSYLQISSISVSPGRDQLVIFHSHHNNDLVIALQGEHHLLKEDRIGEIVAHVSKRYYE